MKTLLFIIIGLALGRFSFSQDNNTIQDLREECIRGQAEPIVIPNKNNKANFQLQADSLTAIETFSSSSGDWIQINNWGCEYYTLTFKIETKKYKADTESLKYWYVKTYELMKEIETELDAPIEINDGLEALNLYVSKNVFDLKLEEEIDFGGDDIRSFVTLHSIEKNEANNYVIEISFSIGPL